jgi:hypothetical protein
MKMREWATPLTIGAFALMSVTGVLMFFHRDAGFNRLAHEWTGLVLVAAVVVHVFANWISFQRYFFGKLAGRGLIALGVVVLAISFIPLGGQGVSPPGLAMRAIVKAPIGSVATLAGRPTEAVLADLAAAGLTLPGPDATLDSVVKGDRELQGRAMRALFGAPQERR